MAEIISNINEDNEGKCVMILTPEEIDALTDVLTDWSNGIYRVAHEDKNIPQMNYVAHTRYALNDVFLGVCGWMPVSNPSPNTDQFSRIFCPKCGMGGGNITLHDKDYWSKPWAFCHNCDIDFPVPWANIVEAS